jgi:hypothetical protein
MAFGPATKRTARGCRRRAAADGAGLINGHAKPTEKLDESLKRKHFSETRPSTRRGMITVAKRYSRPPGIYYCIQS